MNVVTEAEGSPAAVLIRALHPVDGVPVMRRRRARHVGSRREFDRRNFELCRGPGNVTTAMGITVAHNRIDLTGSRLFVEDQGVSVGAVAWTARVGIRVGLEHSWRVYVVGDPAVSALRKTASGGAGSARP